MIVHFPEVERKSIVALAQRTLWEEDTQDVREALEYLRNKRNLSDEVIKDFNFGYYPTRLRQQGHDWAGRLIMPLIDQNNELVVLTSRDFRCTDKTKMPHLHEEFNKKMFLYGVNVAKKSIIEYQKAVVVEGQFDTTHSHKHGISCTVGILGSAFSLQHMCVLARYTQNIFLVFDNDESGLRNLYRSILMYKNYGLDVHNIKFIPVILPKHKDPDEFLKNEGKKEYLALLADAKSKVEDLGTVVAYEKIVEQNQKLQTFEK
jgi:DNA primase